VCDAPLGLVGPFSVRRHLILQGDSTGITRGNIAGTFPSEVAGLPVLRCVGGNSVRSDLFPGMVPTPRDSCPRRTHAISWPLVVLCPER
jgi:hypothetical protein